MSERSAFSWIEEEWERRDGGREKEKEGEKVARLKSGALARRRE